MEDANAVAEREGLPFRFRVGVSRIETPRVTSSV
jgi:hypothetical protein